MSGFFEIVNLGNGLVSETKDLFHSNYPAAKDFLKMNSSQLFLTGIHQDFPIVSLKETPELTYASWCRLDNLAELQQALGLKQSAQEPEVILQGFKKGVQIVSPIFMKTSVLRYGMKRINYYS